MIKVTTRIEKLYPPSGGRSSIRSTHNTDRDGSEYWSRHGSVSTPQGFVVLHSYGSTRGRGSTLMEIIKNGYLHRRWYEKAYSEKHMITLAKRFATEVFDDSTV